MVVLFGPDIRKETFVLDSSGPLDIFVPPFDRLFYFVFVIFNDKSRNSRWESRSHLPLATIQAHLPTEVAPLLLKLGSYTRTTDKSVERFFDEACKESLTTRCLNKAQGFQKKAQYVEVPNFGRQLSPVYHRVNCAPELDSEQIPIFRQ